MAFLRVVVSALVLTLCTSASTPSKTLSSPTVASRQDHLEYWIAFFDSKAAKVSHRVVDEAKYQEELLRSQSPPPAEWREELDSYLGNERKYRRPWAGLLWRSTAYFKAKRHGTFVLYQNFGVTRRTLGQHWNGKRVGTWTVWERNGDIQWQVVFDNSGNVIRTHTDAPWIGKAKREPVLRKLKWENGKTRMIAGWRRIPGHEEKYSVAEFWDSDGKLRGQLIRSGDVDGVAPIFSKTGTLQSQELIHESSVKETRTAAPWFTEAEIKAAAMR